MLQYVETKMIVKGKKKKKLLFYCYQEFLMLKVEPGVYEVGKAANVGFMDTFYICGWQWISGWDVLWLCSSES